MREREYSLYQFALKSRLTEKVLGGFSTVLKKEG